MSRILSIDTSTSRLGVALSEEGKVKKYVHYTDGISHSKNLISKIDELLQSAGDSLGAIDAFAVSIGPGSFTGLRIGVATIKGFSIALEKPIIVVDTYEAIAREYIHLKNKVHVVGDAKRGNVYHAIFYLSDGTLCVEQSTQLAPIADSKFSEDDILVVGDGARLLAESQLIPPGSYRDEAECFPDICMIDQIAWEKFNAKEFADLDKVEPLYLYPQDCSVKK